MSRPHRPKSVTISIAGVFLLGMWNVWRVALLVQQRHFLRQLDVSLDPTVRLVLALLWALLFLALAVALWRRWRWARWSALVALALYTLYHLALTAFFVPAAAARQGWLASLLLGVGAIIWLSWALYRPALRSYWQTLAR